MTRNLRTFYIVAVTQVFSLIGSSMTSIALGIQIFNDTGKSTPLTLAALFVAIPPMLGGSLAGVFADKWNRRLILMLTDFGQGLGTTVLLSGFLTGNFMLWHLYLVSFVNGLLSMFQRPAMEASVTMLVPENHRDRANTVRQITGPTAGIIAPVITGFVYASIGVVGVMIVDLATFIVAVGIVSLVHIPQPGKNKITGNGTTWQELRIGMDFLLKNKILILIMVYAALINFLLAGPMTLSTPYIIVLTGSEATLGILLGFMNIGIVTGGVFMMIFGGTRPRIHGIMLGLLFRSFWLILYGIVRTPLMLGMALFFIFSTNALVDASFMSIIQAKVPPNMQGRVFALLFQMMYIATPLSLLIAGPLVDNVLEPAVNTSWWHYFNFIVGHSPGSGIGLLMTTAGLCMLVLTVLVYSYRKVRSVENDLPDYNGI